MRGVAGRTSTRVLQRREKKLLEKNLTWARKPLWSFRACAFPTREFSSEGEEVGSERTGEREGKNTWEFYMRFRTECRRPFCWKTLVTQEGEKEHKGLVRLNGAPSP